ncbi:hypothetical protein T440DRAFT_486207 [Plenodomus tracheiphilus IPT5]|uniref:Cora-domain-containing protein n=1 Tax=Plenodomus tracheiphilus IPT5 TaxID=1408161 RepID=A0A6A7BKE0_9PLEO|nr:hypothetical protein T440DRAFT_486207 [Plenodomus tracheiphilus IPT5]
MTFRSLAADHTPLDEFHFSIPEVKRAKRQGSDSYLPLHVFEWSESQSDGIEICDVRSVEKLLTQSQGSVRIVFAPRDEPHPSTVEGLVNLFERCEIPSAFVNESLQGISQSFGAYHDADGAACVWFHILCKDLAVDQNRIVHPQDNAHNPDESRIAAQRQSHANFTWLKPGFVLKTRDPGTPRPLKTSPSTSDVTLSTPSGKAQVELFCFGAPTTFRDRFRKLITTTTSEDLIEDPYILLDIVFEEMYKVLDRTAWVVGNIFGGIETVIPVSGSCRVEHALISHQQTLAMASNPGKATRELLSDHFTIVHNLAKHNIYLRENCEAALATLEDLRETHQVKIGDCPSPSQRLTGQALRYRRTLFQSTQCRLASLDARMANVIQLSFHIVTQGDSLTMQSESRSMRLLAVITLIFMPLSTVAGIFGTQFMKLQDEKPYHITVSRDFWLLWVIVLPLTVIVFLVWRVWYMDAKVRLIGDMPQRANGEFGYMGWKSFGKRDKTSQEKA